MANVGRDMTIKKNNVVIAGLRSKTFTIGREPIDITTDDSTGYRTLLGDDGQRSIDASFDGITNDDVLLDLMLGTSTVLLTDVVLEMPNGDTISGDFYLNSLEFTGAYNDAQTFSGSLQSSGTWTHTPAV